MNLEVALKTKVNALAIMSKSSMPQVEQDELISTLSKLLGIALNMAQFKFNLTDDEAISLLTLVMMEVMEIVDD